MGSWFGFGRAAPSAKSEDSPVRALPASWYHSPAMYQLERRAIFSKKWILVSHRLRYANPGDFVQITEAGFAFFIVRDRQDNIQAFHNLCRHRAYPVVEKGSGTARILACKYHGWSYGLNGKLAKAPKYQDLPSFDKEGNGLFKIHTHVDKLGFVWVNLNASVDGAPSWENDFGGFDTQSRLEKFNMEDYHFDHEWGMVGDYNWKTLSDNYNECYHCPTGHPGIAGVSDFNKYYVETVGGHVQHFNTDRPDKEGLGIFSSFLFPNASITVSADFTYVSLLNREHFFYIMRCIPISSTQTKMEYEVYRGNSSSDEDFTTIDEIFKQVLREDKDLCNAAQKNLEAGVFINGELHPKAEKGPLYLQGLTRDLVMSHRREEERLGKDVWPATPTVASTEKSQEDSDFCRKLDCEGGPNAELAW